MLAPGWELFILPYLPLSSRLGQQNIPFKIHPKSVK